MKDFKRLSHQVSIRASDADFSEAIGTDKFFDDYIRI
jgi:hypothetical protein